MERLEKAKIISLNTGKILIFQFNPEQYTLSKQISWNSTPNKGKDVGESEYSSGQPASLSLKLLFDTTETGLDVRLEYAILMELTKPKSLIPGFKTDEPPKCRFIWGKIPSFTAVITNVSQTFTMFLGDGTPVRARVDVTLQEVKDELDLPFQNPTSRSEPRKTRQVRLGDRIDLLAYEEYGDANYWLALAEANDLENPLTLEPGQILNIPVLL